MKWEPETWKDFLGKKRNRLVLLVVCGVIFLLLSWPGGSGKEETDTSETAQTAVDEAADTAAYVERLESRLEELLSTIDGVGQVSVMITVSSSSEQVLKEDVNVSENLAEESGADSYRSESSSSRNTSTFTDGDSSPYVVKEMMPTVEGVVVSAEGASSAVVCQEIKEAVQALFSVEAHKIKVLKRES